MPQVKASPARRNGRPQPTPEPELPPPPVHPKTWLFLCPPGELPLPQGEVDHQVVAHLRYQAAVLGIPLQEWMLALLTAGLSEYLQSRRSREEDVRPSVSLLLPLPENEWRTIAWMRRDFTEFGKGLDALGGLVVGSLEEVCAPTLTLYAERLAGKGLTPAQVVRRLQVRAREHEELPWERQQRIMARDLGQFVEKVEAGHYRKALVTSGQEGI